MKREFATSEDQFVELMKDFIGDYYAREDFIEISDIKNRAKACFVESSLLLLSRFYADIIWSTERQLEMKYMFDQTDDGKSVSENMVGDKLFHRILPFRLRLLSVNNAIDEIREDQSH